MSTYFIVRVASYKKYNYSLLAHNQRPLGRCCSAILKQNTYKPFLIVALDTFQLLQYNIYKSKNTVAVLLLANPYIKEFYILAI